MVAVYDCCNWFSLIVMRVKMMTATASLATEGRHVRGVPLLEELKKALM